MITSLYVQTLMINDLQECEAKKKKKKTKKKGKIGDYSSLVLHLLNQRGHALL